MKAARRIFALLLCVIMCAGLIPGQVFAEEVPAAAQPAAFAEDNSASLIEAEAIEEAEAAEEPAAEEAVTAEEPAAAEAAEEAFSESSDPAGAEAESPSEWTCMTGGEAEVPEFPVSGHADEIEISVYNEAAFAETGTVYGTPQAAGKYLRDQMVNRESSVTISFETSSENYSTEVDNFIAAVWLYVEQHTGVPYEGDYLERTYGGSSWSGSGTFNADGTRIIWTYDFTIQYYTTAEQEQYVASRVNEILNGLGVSDMQSDYMKIKAIYTWICSNVTYDYTHLSDSSYKLQYTAYAALANKTAVCQGYSTLFYYMALTAGVDTRYISGTGGSGSNSGPHGWNIVKLGNLWYNLDSTWDSNYGSDFSSYEYFLKSNDTFPDHTRNEKYTTDEFNAAYPMSTTDYVEGQDPLTITTQPKNVSAKAGSTAKFTVVASGTGLTYQWQYSTDSGKTWKNSPATGSTTSTVSISVAANKNGYLYRCVVTDANGATATSNSAKLTVTSGVTITTQPKNVSAAVGSTAKFTVVASGTGLTYQWQYSTNSGSTWKNSPATGNTTSTVSISAAANKNGYLYRCIVTDANGATATSSSAKLTVTSATVTITTQPKDVSAAVGSTVKFTVAASGTGLTYQWQYSTNSGSTWTNSPATGNTTKTVSISVAANKNGYLYRCVVTDANGKTAASSSAKLTVKPAITAQPADVSAEAGTSVTFKITATGAGLTYQWQYSGNDGDTWKSSPATGNTTDTLTVTANRFRDGNLYRCVVTDANGATITSDSARLTLKTSASETYTATATGVTNIGAFSADIGVLATIDPFPDNVDEVYVGVQVGRSASFNYDGVRFNQTSRVLSAPSSGTGYENIQITIDYDALDPETTYYYRTVIEIGDDTYYGDTGSFTTVSGSAVQLALNQQISSANTDQCVLYTFTVPRDGTFNIEVTGASASVFEDYDYVGSSNVDLTGEAGDIWNIYLSAYSSSYTVIVTEADES